MAESIEFSGNTYVSKSGEVHTAATPDQFPMFDPASSGVNDALTDAITASKDCVLTVGDALMSVEGMSADALKQMVSAAKIAYAANLGLREQSPCVKMCVAGYLGYCPLAEGYIRPVGVNLSVSSRKNNSGAIVLQKVTPEDLADLFGLSEGAEEDESEISASDVVDYLFLRMAGIRPSTYGKPSNVRRDESYHDASVKHFNDWQRKRVETWLVEAEKKNGKSPFGEEVPMFEMPASA